MGGERRISAYRLEQPQRPEAQVGTAAQTQISTLGMEREFPSWSYASSPQMQKWDQFIFILLLYVCLVVPFECAFLDVAVGSAIFVINRFLDVAFITDMVLSFRVVPIDLEERAREMVEPGPKIRAAIVSNYLKGWFGFDLVATIPYDLISVTISEASGADANGLRVLRVLRICRVFRMVRVFKVQCLC